MLLVFLISCTKSKQDYGCTAEEMYKRSTFYRAALQYATNRVKDKGSQIFVLSAKYGLLSLSDPISPYDLTLKAMSPSECDEWGQRVFRQITHQFSTNTFFVFLASAAYIKPLIKHLNTSNFSTPLDGMSQGVRVHWLQQNACPNKFNTPVSTDKHPMKQGNLSKHELADMITAREPRATSEMVSIWAHKLRSDENLKTVSGSKPGWYRWWAPAPVLNLFLNSPYITKEYMQELLPHLWRRDFCQGSFFCIYIGVAIKESIRDRLNWHINQHHTKSAVQNGILSTFRKTVASLVAGDPYDEDATNRAINQLMIEYCTVNYPIRSEIAKSLIHQIERDELERYVLPLNIMGNHHIVLKSYLSDLRMARKVSSQCR